MAKETFRDLLLTQLDRSVELRARMIEDADFSERRRLLRAWQAARLARTHQDLLESRRFHDAAQFFLNDLYGPSDLSRHIEDVRRIVPVMTSVLPDSGLAAVTHAVELNVVSESYCSSAANLQDSRRFFHARGSIRLQNASFFALDPGKLLRFRGETVSNDMNSAVDSSGSGAAVATRGGLERAALYSAAQDNGAQ